MPALERPLRQGLFAMAGCFTVAAMLLVLPPALGLLLVVSLLCVAWQCHLASRGFACLWTAPLTALLVDRLFIHLLRATRQELAMGLAALLYGTLAYLMFATLSLRNQRGLQPLASMAILLALSLFGHPSILSAGFVASLALWLSSRRRFGGYPESAVLIFTPAVLSVFFTLFLQFLGIALVRCPLLQLDFLKLSSWHYYPATTACLRQAGVLFLFPLGLLASRLFDGCAGTIDLAYAALAGLFMVSEIVLPVTGASEKLNIDIILVGAAMALVTANPPRRLVSRMLLELSAASAFLCNAILG